MSVVGGLALGVRGIVGKEVRSRSRGWRPMLLLTFYLVVLALVVVTVLGVAVAQTGTISPNLGQFLFGALAAGSVLLVASLPALGIVYLFGGVPLMTVVASLVVTLATALGYSALGLLFSAVFRRT